jgi:hypothetical protein
VRSPRATQGQGWPAPSHSPRMSQGWSHNTMSPPPDRDPAAAWRSPAWTRPAEPMYAAEPNRASLLPCAFSNVHEP